VCQFDLWRCRCRSDELSKTFVAINTMFAGIPSRDNRRYAHPHPVCLSSILNPLRRSSYLYSITDYLDCQWFMIEDVTAPEVTAHHIS
jgi:hypothetical protein